MIYLVANRENLFSMHENSSPNVSISSKSDMSTYGSPTVGSFLAGNPGKLNISSDCKEDDVDIQLDKMNGKIPRQRDAQLYVIVFIFKENSFISVDVSIIYMENVYIAYLLSHTTKNI